MDEFDSERSNYVNSHESPLHVENEGLWKTYGTSIFLGFLATALLISMFLIVAILEQFFRPNASLTRSTQHAIHRLNDPRPMHKVVDPQPHVQVGNASDLSVLMPGHKYPTYIAHPTPLPCSREGVYWPSHCQHNLVDP